MHRGVSILPVLALLNGCGSPTEPDALTIEGTWEYSVSNLEFSDATCALAGVILTLYQRGDQFVGFASGGTGACNGAPPTPLREMTVNEGRIDRDAGAVIFKVTGDLSNAGILAGRTITGTVRSQNMLGSGGGVGTFVMTKR